MLYREIIAVCSEIHTKHINTLCGQNGESLNVKLAVHTANTGGTYSDHCAVLIVTTVRYMYYRQEEMCGLCVTCGCFVSCTGGVRLKLRRSNNT